MNIFLITLLCFCICTTQCFSRFYGRCTLHHGSNELSQMPHQIVQKCRGSGSSVKNSNTLIPNITLNFTDFNLINYKYLDAGASGEVFLMQDPDTNQFYIVKRFFKEGRFAQEEFIMKQLGYQVQWARDPTHGNVMAIYPYYDSKTIDQVLFTRQENRIVFYKIIKQLLKTHQTGLMHMDIKPMNVIVDTYKNQDGEDVTKKSQVTLIDWNLANTYYLGAHYTIRRGTPCYMAPELILWSEYYTPAVDVWSLGMTLVSVAMGSKPLEGCSKNSLKAMIRFVGHDAFKALYKKLRVKADQDILSAMDQLRDEPGDLEDFLTDTRQDSILPSLKKVLQKMLRIDPNQRISLEQLLKEDYFKAVVELPAPKQEKEKRKKGLRNSELL